MLGGIKRSVVFSNAPLEIPSKSTVTRSPEKEPFLPDVGLVRPSYIQDFGK